ncbi:hypothetical protein [Marinicrinis lubricantis]|uniref:Uncharacterized protein n=1 Tax=Marinicrinis lubricantis TaxID=2086470 RepID=A0ABW1IVJ5_9BACL
MLYVNHGRKTAWVCGLSVKSYVEVEEAVQSKVEELQSWDIGAGGRICLHLPDSFTLLEWVIACWRMKISLLVLGQKDDALRMGSKLQRFRPQLCVESNIPLHLSSTYAFREKIDYRVKRIGDYDDASVVADEMKDFNALYEFSDTFGEEPRIRTARSIWDEWHGQMRSVRNQVGPSSRVLCMAPIHRSFGLISAALYTMHRGGTLYFTSYYRKEEWLELLILNQITHMYALSSQYKWFKAAIELASPYLKHRLQLLAEHTPLGADIDSFYLQHTGHPIVSPYDEVEEALSQPIS